MLVGEMDDYEGVKTRLEEQLGEPIKGWAFQMAIDLGFVDNYLGEEIDYEYLETRYLGIIDQEDEIWKDVAVVTEDKSMAIAAVAFECGVFSYEDV